MHTLWNDAGLAGSRTMSRAVAQPGPSRLWAVAQWLGLLSTVGLLGALVGWPEASLHLLWYVIIPVLPATFLLNSTIWRNVCPLATLTTLTGNRVGSWRIERAWVGRLGAVGIGLLAVMVPARRFLFNTDGTALAATVVGVGLLALVGGLLFNRKAGFCNAVCPVLSVERLYGQRPLLSVPDARCTRCTLCTPLGCLDIAPRTSALQVLGEAGRSRAWPLTAFGAFALAFPGFVTAYYLLDDVPLANAFSVYGTVALWSAGSWLGLGIVFRILRVQPERALLLCGALAVGLYYWFAPPGIAEVLALSSWFTWGARLLMLSLLGFWLLNGVRPSTTRLEASGTRRGAAPLITGTRTALHETRG